MWKSLPFVKWNLQVLEAASNLEEVTETVDYYVQGNTIAAGNLFGRWVWSDVVVIFFLWHTKKKKKLPMLLLYNVWWRHGVMLLFSLSMVCPLILVLVRVCNTQFLTNFSLYLFLRRGLINITPAMWMSSSIPPSISLAL